MCSSLEGQMAVLGAEIRAAQVELPDLTLRSFGAHGLVNLALVGRDAVVHC